MQTVRNLSVFRLEDWSNGLNGWAGGGAGRPPCSLAPRRATRSPILRLSRPLFSSSLSFFGATRDARDCMQSFSQWLCLGGSWEESRWKRIHWREPLGLLFCYCRAPAAAVQVLPPQQFLRSLFCAGIFSCYQQPSRSKACWKHQSRAASGSCSAPAWLCRVGGRSRNASRLSHPPAVLYVACGNAESCFSQQGQDADLRVGRCGRNMRAVSQPGVALSVEDCFPASQCLGRERRNQSVKSFTCRILDRRAGIQSH